MQDIAWNLEAVTFSLEHFDDGTVLYALEVFIRRVQDVQVMPPLRVLFRPIFKLIRRKLTQRIGHNRLKLHRVGTVAGNLSATLRSHSPAEDCIKALLQTFRNVLFDRYQRGKFRVARKPVGTRRIEVDPHPQEFWFAWKGNLFAKTEVQSDRSECTVDLAKVGIPIFGHRRNVSQRVRMRQQTKGWIPDYRVYLESISVIDKTP